MIHKIFTEVWWPVMRDDKKQDVRKTLILTRRALEQALTSSSSKKSPEIKKVEPSDKTSNKKKPT